MRKAIVTGLVTLLAACATVPTVSPQRYLKGLDVSSYQRSIDWDNVAAQDYKFVYVKATEGDDWVDQSFETNVDGANKAGVKVGCYHYATPGTGNSTEYNLVKDAREEADHFLNTAQSCLKSGNLRPALDLEHEEGIEKLTNDEFSLWVLTWVGEVENRISVKPVVYGYNHKGFFYPQRVAETDPEILTCDLWIASYYGKPFFKPWKNWTFWQYSAIGRVDGVQGNNKGYVDLNLFNGSLDDFNRMLIP